MSGHRSKYCCCEAFADRHDSRQNKKIAEDDARTMLSCYLHFTYIKKRVQFLDLDLYLT